ncbi:MAG: hypothetical protein ACE5IR_02620 [bacterium]
MKKNLAILFLLILPCLSKSFGQSAELFLKLGHTGPVNSLAFTPNGALLATGSADNTIKIWNTETGEMLRTLSAHEADIFSIALSPNGRTLASAGYDAKLILWDMVQGEILNTIDGHEQPVVSIAISPDGQLVATASRDPVVRVWDISDGRLIFSLAGHYGQVREVAFSPDGRWLASSGDDGTVRIWDLANGTLFRSLKTHKAEVTCVVFSSNYQFLASGSNDSSVHIWNTANWTLLHVLSEFNAPIKALSFSQDNTLLAAGSGDSSLYVWETDSWQLSRSLGGHDSEIVTLAFQPGKNTLVSSGKDGSLRIWDLESGDEFMNLQAQSRNIPAVVFDKDGQLTSGHEDGSVKIWDVISGALQHDVKAHSQQITSLAYSHDGRFLATASPDTTIKIWDQESGRFLRELHGRPGVTNAVVFSPGGDRFAAASADSTIRIWDTSSWQLLYILAGHNAGVASLAFSPNEPILASGSDDYTVKIWDGDNGSLLRTLFGHSSLVKWVDFSPDGGLLASASSDNSIKLWDTETWRELRTLTGHSSPVRIAVFSPDNRTMASGSLDNTIKIWNVFTGEPIQTLRGHSNDVHSLAYSPDGKMLASASPDGIIKIWETSTHTLQMNIATLPENHWLAYQPGKTVTHGSPGAEKYAAIRGNRQLDRILPLKKTIRLPTEEDAPTQSAQEADANKSSATRFLSGKNILWIGGLLLVLTIGFVGSILMTKRSRTMNVVKIFFNQAGFHNIERLSEYELLLQPQNGQKKGLACLWKNGEIVNKTRIRNLVQSYKISHSHDFCLYLIYEEIPPEEDFVQRLRQEQECQTIPIRTSALRQAVFADNCVQKLAQYEDPYLLRKDPYLDLEPVQDPSWFYGREDYLDHLPSVLAQGRHVGIFGLPKIGKTSLLYQIQHRLDTPTVFIDCEGMPAKAEVYFQEILKQLQFQISMFAQKKEGLIKLPCNFNDFIASMLAILETWQKIGKSKPLLLIFDGADNLYPKTKPGEDDPSLIEYYRLFRVLRGLAQNHPSLATLVTAYRPDINRKSLNIPDLGKNPLFHFFQEEFLVFLKIQDSARMVKQIGLLKNIRWEENAIERVFYYCGGHPFITRIFASQASQAGMLKIVDYGRVESTSKEIQQSLTWNRLCSYFQEGLWSPLQEVEKDVLKKVCAGGEQGLPEQEISQNRYEALDTLENFGLIANDLGRLSLTSEFFSLWLRKQKC